MPTYGLRPDDIVRDSRGDVMIDLIQTFYASRPDAEMQVNPLGTATSAKDGKWQFTHSASGVFGRDPEGNIRFYDSEEPKLSSAAGLVGLARTPDALITGAITRDSNGAATSAAVTWPDGTPGTYTATTVSTAFPGSVDAYTITYGSPVTKTFTQPLVTRNADGAAVAVPAITVS